MTQALAKRTGRPTKAETQQKKSVVQQRASGNVAKRQTLPEYLEASEVDVLVDHADGFRQKLLMRLMWRAGLRVSEALDLMPADIRLEDEPPVLFIREGKGSKDRLVPVHISLKADLMTAQDVEVIPARGIIFKESRFTAWRWVKAAQKRAEVSGRLPQGRVIKPHTLRHSAARHWLVSGVPINTVQRWMGHAGLSTTLIYLEILPDPTGYMERVP